MLSKYRFFIVQGDSWTDLAFTDGKSHVFFESFPMVLVLNRLVEWFARYVRLKFKKKFDNKI